MLLSGATKIAKLVNLNDLVVKAQVLESEIGQVVQGRDIRVKFTALPELEDLTGTVKAISPFVNDSNKTVEAVLSFKNKDERVRPGMFAEARIDAAIFTDRLMVPKTAILPRDNRKVVFKVSTENRAKWEYVTTGEENDGYVEITEGNLEPGDMVLTDNHFTMGHDTLVSIASKE
jgi:RND family efflux transporter MFP subunit